MLLYLSVLILVCVVDFDILRFCLSGCFMCVVHSGMVWLVFRLSCEIVWNIWACLLGEWCSHGSDAFFWTLLLREIQDNMYI